MIQKPKGTYDIYGTKSLEMAYLRKLIEALMDKYHVKYIETPIFESSELFHRGVGETTDIVSKETYDFKDRGNRNMTLRPEGTAGVVRAFLENKIYTIDNLSKFWYFGPMFRYERPQAGRYREFYQFGVEVFGESSAVMDAEVISMVANFLKFLGLKGVKVKINTLGDQESRGAYRNALLAYFKPHLSSHCQNRYEKNPLRILDCKVDADKDIMKNAPKIKDYLNEESKKHYENLKHYLDIMNIEYEVDYNIVRGLDYYTHTVFEVVADIKDFGSQNVLAGGGRYNNLVENIGGPQTPGVGFAVGLERLISALEAENIDIAEKKPVDLYVFMTNKEDLDYTLKLVNNLRLNGFNVEMDYSFRNFKNNFKQADKLEAKFIIIIGEEERKTDNLTIKDNYSKEEYKINIDNLIEFLDEKIGDEHEN